MSFHRLMFLLVSLAKVCCNHFIQKTIILDWALVTTWFTGRDNFVMSDFSFVVSEFIAGVLKSLVWSATNVQHPTWLLHVWWGASNYTNIGLCFAKQLADVCTQCDAMLGKAELLANVAAVVEVALHLYVFAYLFAFQPQGIEAAVTNLHSLSPQLSRCFMKWGWLPAKAMCVEAMNSSLFFNSASISLSTFRLASGLLVILAIKKRLSKAILSNRAFLATWSSSLFCSSSSVRLSSSCSICAYSCIYRSFSCLASSDSAVFIRSLYREIMRSESIIITITTATNMVMSFFAFSLTFFNSKESFSSTNWMPTLLLHTPKNL